MVHIEWATKGCPTSLAACLLQKQWRLGIPPLVGRRDQLKLSLSPLRVKTESGPWLERDFDVEDFCKRNNAKNSIPLKQELRPPTPEDIDVLEQTL